MDALKAPEWLFFDHFHQNARGTALVAERIGNWANQTTDMER
jgi:lysophospholipase L1-like esterase